MTGDKIIDNLLSRLRTIVAVEDDVNALTLAFDDLGDVRGEIAKRIGGLETRAARCRRDLMAETADGRRHIRRAKIAEESVYERRSA